MGDSTNDINWMLPPVNYISDHEEPVKFHMSELDGQEFVRFDLLPQGVHPPFSEQYKRRLMLGTDPLSVFIRQHYPELIESEYTIEPGENTLNSEN